MGEVIDIDEAAQKAEMKKTLDHLEKWINNVQAQITMIELLIKGLR